MKQSTNKNFEIIPVQAGEHLIYAYSKMPTDETTYKGTLLCLNGGPGLPCDYLRDSHEVLCDEGYRVVAFDQLGTGNSDNPNDPSLWTIQRYSNEVEAVRETLALGKIHLLGHSWGGWLAIEYAVQRPQMLESLILQGTAADIPLLTSEMDRLRSALGHETVTMMRRYEAVKDWDNEEYKAAITLLNHRHVCRLAEIPPAYQRSRDGSNQEIYRYMQGPNEFHYIGNLREWSRVKDLHKINVPVLITAGQYDEITPTCAMQMDHHLKNSKVHIFPKSSHHPHFEEPDEYYPVLMDFLNETVDVA